MPEWNKQRIQPTHSPCSKCVGCRTNNNELKKVKTLAANAWLMHVRAQKAAAPLVTGQRGRHSPWCTTPFRPWIMGSTAGLSFPPTWGTQGETFAVRYSHTTLSFTKDGISFICVSFNALSVSQTSPNQKPHPSSTRLVCEQPTHCLGPD